MELWGRANSINVQKVLWALDELGLEATRHDAGGAFGGLEDPAYLARNPTGLIPTLQDGDSVHWESNAILRYLGAAHDPDCRLWPRDPVAQSACDRWLDWQQTTLWPVVKVIFWQLIRTPEEQRDQGAITAAIDQGNLLMGLLDRHLGGQPWMGGGDFTLADIPVGITVHRWMVLPFEGRGRFGPLEDWYQRISARPAFTHRIAHPLT